MSPGHLRSSWTHPAWPMRAPSSARRPQGSTMDIRPVRQNGRPEAAVSSIARGRRGSHGAIGDPSVRCDADQEQHIGRRTGGRNGAEAALEFCVAPIAQRHQRRVHDHRRRAGDANQRALHLGDGVRCTDAVTSGEHEAAHLELEPAGRQVDAGFSAQRGPRLAATRNAGNQVAGLDDADHGAPLDVLRCGWRGEGAHQEGGSHGQRQRARADTEPFNESHGVLPCVASSFPTAGHTAEHHARSHYSGYRVTATYMLLLQGRNTTEADRKVPMLTIGPCLDASLGRWLQPQLFAMNRDLTVLYGKRVSGTDQLRILPPPMCGDTDLMAHNALEVRLVAR